MGMVRGLWKEVVLSSAARGRRMVAVVDYPLEEAGLKMGCHTVFGLSMKVR